MRILFLMGDHADPPPSGGNDQVYCRFGKRDLDGMSWLAPLVNNRIGDRINLELRHEQLFFIQGERVIDDVGYSEKGTRFSEADYGKPIRSMADLRRHGYWLTGRRYREDVMREALARQQDGFYYSLFSNQCQDWADRLRGHAEAIEKERGLACKLDADRDEQPLGPTVPASWLMGAVATALGLAAFLLPTFFSGFFLKFLGALLLAAGCSQIAYAFHAQDWRNFLAHATLSLGWLAGGAFYFINQTLALVTNTVGLAGFLGIFGVLDVVLAVRSRPFRNWWPTLLNGLFFVACAAMVVLRWPASSEAFLGSTLGLCLLSGGLSTIWLSLRTRKDQGEVPVNQPTFPTHG